MAWNQVAIVGAGLIPFGELFDMSYEAMIQQVYLRAIQSVDNGMDPEEIEAGWLGTCMGSIWVWRFRAGPPRPGPSGW